MRADRLVSLVLLLEARGRTTARSLADELGVSVRTIYRDLAGLSASGVPVIAEPGPGGGCQLLDGYRFPLRGLRPEEAEALLILGVPDALRELGLEGAVAAAHRRIRVTAGQPGPGEPGTTLVHLDMPRWFGSDEPVPSLGSLADALRQGRNLALRYRRGNGGTDPEAPRVAGPLGLVNKAGTWYLVAVTRSGRIAVFRVGRIASARVLAEPADRPAGFDLARFWERWSREFESSRPRLRVRLRASPEALAVFPEIFGDGAREAIGAALPPDERGWRELALSFEHEPAAAHRLAGFGGEVEILSPRPVRERLLATAHAILDRYRSAPRPPARQSRSGQRRTG